MELVRQLRSLDQRFYTCVDFERLETQAESIDQLVLSQKRPAGKHELKTGKKMFDSAAGFSYKSALDFFIRRVRSVDTVAPARRPPSVCCLCGPYGPCAVQTPPGFCWCRTCARTAVATQVSRSRCAGVKHAFVGSL